MSRTWKVRIAEAADADIDNIIEWTAGNFGPVQAERYLQLILSAMRALEDGPAAIGSKPIAHVPPGYFGLHVARKGQPASHTIIFRADVPGMIQLVRVLHDRMDLPRHLP